MMPHNNIGLSCKGSENIATEITKYRRFNHPVHCRLNFEAPSPRNVHEYQHEPYTA